MKRIMVAGKADLRWEDRAVPAPGAGEALLRVRMCGVCGTDIAYYRHGPMGAAQLAIGHEIVGTIEAIGAGVTSLKPGDDVVVNGSAEGNWIGSGGSEGGFSDYVLLRQVDRGDVAYAIPDGLGFERAALVEPLAVGRRAVNRSGAQPGQRVCLFGAGPIGLGVLLSLRDRGVDDVVVVDGSAFRRELAMTLGARATIDPGADDLQAELARHHGDGSFLGRPALGTDIFFDAAGAASIVPEVVRLCHRSALLVLIAVYHDTATIDWRAVLAKELTIMTSMGHPVEYPEVIDMVTRQGDALAPYVSHQFPFRDFETAITVAADVSRASKVLVEMPE